MTTSSLDRPEAFSERRQKLFIGLGIAAVSLVLVQILDWKFKRDTTDKNGQKSSTEIALRINIPKELIAASTLMTIKSGDSTGSIK